MNLSNAEINVAKYLTEGHSNKEIADKLFVSEKTIKFHLTNIYSKAGVSSRSEFISFYLKNSLNFEEKYNGGSVDTLPNNKGYLAPTTSQELTRQQETRNDISQRDKINFIDEKFKIGSSIDQLHHMMIEVTKKDMNANNVNAACNCVTRINETINTAIQAARFLSGR